MKELNTEFEKEFIQMGGSNEDIYLFKKIRNLIKILIKMKFVKYKRYLPLADYLIDRWERASYCGMGEGSSVYDSCLILGEVKVGKNTWVGPFTILDGSGGGLIIGDNCVISAGVHIYTHDTVDRVIYGSEITRSPVSIGNNVYIGPNSIISKGVTIGDFVIIGANSFVNINLPPYSKAIGSPVRIIDKINL